MATMMEPPKAIRSLPGWLRWELVAIPGEAKPRKIPHYAHGGPRGAHGTQADQSQLVTFAEALEASRGNRWAGVGFAPRLDWGIVALDFDDCLVNGVVDPEVESLLVGTYAEYSPSGAGVRAFVRGDVPQLKDPAHDGIFGIETFHDSGYVTFTGRPLPVCSVFDCEDIIAGASPKLVAFILARAQQKNDRGAVDTTSEEFKFDRELALRGVTAETLVELRSALMTGWTIAQADGYDTWANQAGQALASLKGTIHEDAALALWHDFSARSGKYNAAYSDEKWDTFRPSRITFRSIFDTAQANGWINPASLKGIKTGDISAYAKLEDRTDVGNANRLLRITDGDLRYVLERELWLWWDGSRWTADEFRVNAVTAALLVSKEAHAKAAEVKDAASGKDDLSDDERKRISKAADSAERWAAQCRNKRNIDAMLAMASRDSRVTVAATSLDSDPWLLGVDNGVVDLRTGRLRDAARDEFVTKRSPVAFDPAAKAPRWAQFIAEVTGTGRDGRVGEYEPRPALAQYLQSALGYSLTGSTAEQKMFIALGEGSNGKNVLLDVIKEVIGGYARTVAPEALMATKHDADAERPSPTAASLEGARLAISSESRDGARLDATLVKAHTGNRFMTARRMRENTFEFVQTHKLWLMTNHKPALDHLDGAMKGRLHLIPFGRRWNRPGHPEPDPTLPNGDPNLTDKLRAEAPGILRWLVEGAVRYCLEGLVPPAEVVALTKDYFLEQDPLGRWLEGYERCEPKKGTLASELFRQFSAWQRDEDGGSGIGPANPTAFGKKLIDGHGLSKVKLDNGWSYGLRRKV